MESKFRKYFPPHMLSYLFIVIAGIAFYFSVLRWDVLTAFIGKVYSVLSPFLWGIAIAYLLSGIVKFCENRFLKKVKPFVVKRTLSILIAFAFLFTIVGALLWLIIPELINSIGMLISNISSYIEDFSLTFQEFIGKYDIDPNILQQLEIATQDFETKVMNILEQAIPFIIGLSSNLFSQVVNGILSLFVAVYLLASKERFIAQVKKVLYSFFPPERVKRVTDIASLTNKTFTGFISGKLLDSLIIGILCFIGLSVFNFDYVLLISVMVGITNIIPFFGPFIGAIPSALLLLIVDPIQALWFVLFIIVLQQLDGNVIGPKILGDSIGIPAIWVMFSILVFGSAFGFIGMVLGVPSFAVLYALFKEATENRLAAKGMATETVAYASLSNPIPEETQKPIIKRKKSNNKKDKDINDEDKKYF